MRIDIPRHLGLVFTTPSNCNQAFGAIEQSVKEVLSSLSPKNPGPKISSSLFTELSLTRETKITLFCPISLLMLIAVTDHEPTTTYDPTN